MRGAAVESRHRGAFVIVDASGKVVHRAGDAQMPIYPRSAVKPLQALPLIETGAADRFGLTDKELALACASHKGEPAHVDAVNACLDRIGLSDAALECGIQAPRTPAAAKRVSRLSGRAGRVRSQIRLRGSGPGAAFGSGRAGEPIGLGRSAERFI